MNSAMTSTDSAALRQEWLIRQRWLALQGKTALSGPASLSDQKTQWPGPIPYCPYRPQPKQELFLGLNCREALFGGAAGGGKSFCLLMAALQYVEVPRYRALLLRRTFAELSKPDTLMYTAYEWLKPTAARWTAANHTWNFPSGATLTFGYLDNEGDTQKYKGPGFQFIGWDELTEFTESMYRYMFTRMRRPPGMPVPIRMRSASNPDGIGHAWVKERFITNGGTENRVFVPSRITDNIHVDQAEYISTFDEVNPVTRRQLLEGDWDVRPEGKLFKREWFKIVEAAPV